MARERNYKLKIFDDVLLSFQVTVDEFGRISADITGYDEKKRERLPLQLLPVPTGEKILSWLESRTIPKNRRFFEQILAAAGLRQGDTLGIIDVCKGLSVNDCYWLDDGSEDVSFDDVNLFDNPLDETLAIVAYTGYTSSQRHKIGLSTEWTTDGQFPKAWRRIDNNLYLFKAGRDGFANAGMEPYSEYFAAQAAEAMGIEHVSYDLKMWKGKIASVCPLLNSREVSLVPFWVASGQSWFPGTLAAGYAFSSETCEKLRSMLVFDALICNPDRHAANYSMLRDNYTGRLIDMAPLFDHNLSLFARDMGVDLPHLNERANRIYSPAGSRLSFLENAAAVMGARQHEQLRRMVNFEFRNHPVYPVPQKRLDALNVYISVRVRELLEIPAVDERKLAHSMEQELSGMKGDAPMLGS